jgi:hypothetical protein
MALGANPGHLWSQVDGTEGNVPRRLVLDTRTQADRAIGVGVWVGVGPTLIGETADSAERLT